MKRDLARFLEADCLQEAPERPPSHATRLRHLAHRVERLGAGRSDPEQILCERQLLCRELRRLAREAAA